MGATYFNRKVVEFAHTFTSLLDFGRALRSALFFLQLAAGTAAGCAVWPNRAMHHLTNYSSLCFIARRPDPLTRRGGLFPLQPKRVCPNRPICNLHARNRVRRIHRPPAARYSANASMSWAKPMPAPFPPHAFGLKTRRKRRHCGKVIECVSHRGQT